MDKRLSLPKSQNSGTVPSSRPAGISMTSATEVTGRSSTSATHRTSMVCTVENTYNDTISCYHSAIWYFAWFATSCVVY